MRKKGTRCESSSRLPTPYSLLPQNLSRPPPREIRIYTAHATLTERAHSLMGIFNKIREKVRETVEETKTSLRETVDNLRYDKLKQGLKRTRQGIGEKIGDLRPFDPAAFVDALYADAGSTDAA